MSPSPFYPTLCVHEWLILSLFSGFFLFIGFFALFWNGSDQAWEELPRTAPLPVLVAVTIEGAVVHPGTYLVPRGSTLGDVLKQAQLMPEADTRKLPPSQKIRTKRKIHVPKAEKIRIFVTGEVDTPGEFFVPRGTQLKELPHLLPLTTEASEEVFRSRRRLRSEEDLHVSAKNSVL